MYLNAILSVAMYSGDFQIQQNVVQMETSHLSPFLTKPVRLLFKLYHKTEMCFYGRIYSCLLMDVCSYLFLHFSKTPIFVFGIYNFFVLLKKDLKHGFLNYPMSQSN